VIRVLIVDDHAFFRRTLAGLLDATDDIAAVGECEDGGEAAVAVASAYPDVVVMDVRMGHVSGIEATRMLCRDQPTVKVLMLSTNSAVHTIREAAQAGACGYLVKGGDPGVVIDAVRRVARGDSVWPCPVNVEVC
jgi:DNA-binding NarL/FixJ family response regulator